MILNLTQHGATTEQLAAGVVDLPVAEKAMLVRLLTVDDLPNKREIEVRCHDIAMLGATAFEQHPTRAMIGGAPWMMSALEDALINQGIEPVYAFSRRVSEEVTQPDGAVIKSNIFKHIGFIFVV